MRLRQLAGVLLFALLCACGVKGNLKPIGISEPEAPAWLEIRQQGTSALLQWPLPTANLDGSPLTDLVGFRVARYNYAPEQYCSECLDQETVATVDLAAPVDAIIRGGVVSLRLVHEGPGSGNRYRVYPLTAANGSGHHTEARLVMSSAPPQPLEVMISPLDRGASLAWRFADADPQEGEFLGVNIYRGAAIGPLSSEPLNDVPVTGTTFDDFGIDNDTGYRYGLRSVIRIDGGTVESELSEIVTVTPRAGL